MVQHLTPLLLCGHFSGSNFDELSRLVIRHARSGLIVLDHSFELYSSRYQMPLMTFCVVHLGDVLIHYSPREPPAPEVVRFCLENLQGQASGFHISGPVQELFRRTAVERGIQLPSNIDQMTGPLGNYSIDDILDACTRLDYKQPIDQSIRHLDENIAKDWSSNWKTVVEGPNRPVPPPSTRRPSTSERYLPINSLLNK